MKIVIATPFVPPQSGVLATYASGIESALKEQGHTVVVIAPGPLAALPGPLRMGAYFFKMLLSLRGAACVLSLDVWSVGLPATIAAMCVRVPVAFRIGGDHLWEHYIERTRERVLLSEFYQRPRHFNITERCMAVAIHHLLARARVIFFNTTFQKAIWERAYALSRKKTALLENYYPEKRDPLPVTNRRFVCANRPTVYKNFALFKEAFDRVSARHPEIELDTRMLGHTEQLERLAESYAIVIPSISEVGSNSAIEAVSLGRPFVITLDTGTSERLGGCGLFVDTRSVEDMEKSIESLLDPITYTLLQGRIAEQRFVHSWTDIATEILAGLARAGIGVWDVRDGVHALLVGTDASVAHIGSPAADRHAAYGAHFARLDIIVLGRAPWPDAMLASNVHVYPTRSRTRLTAALDAIRRARQLRPDVISVQDPFEVGFLGWLIARHIRAKFHVQVHTDPFAPLFTHSVMGHFRRAAARFLLRRADRIRTVSARVRASIETHARPSAPIAVLPIYTPLEKFRRAKAGALVGRFAKFSHVLLYVGRLEPEKNVGCAVRAVASALVKYPRLALVIVGEGSERQELERAAAAAGIRAHVFFEGYADPTPYYALADLVLVPSHYEGYGLVIIESLAAGKPVLATDVGIAHEAGAMITDADHFAESLVDWLESGPRVGVLKEDPYGSLEAYARQYADDVRATVTV